VKAVFDTNILIDYLNGVVEAKGELERYTNKQISIITWMEVMVGAKGDEDKILRAFLNGFLVSPLTPSVAEKGVELRQTHKLKLPDAIIYATAREAGCLFVTRNTKDFDDTLPDVRVPYSL
jgi:predicted nucleic acid-binding protein